MGHSARPKGRSRVGAPYCSQLEVVVTGGMVIVVPSEKWEGLCYLLCSVEAEMRARGR